MKNNKRLKILKKFPLAPMICKPIRIFFHTFQYNFIFKYLIKINMAIL